MSRKILVAAAVLTALTALLTLGAGCNMLGQLQDENELEKKVRQSLNQDPRLRAAEITIIGNMDSGEVTLSGEVSIPELIEIAGNLAREVEGVTNVINKMTMQEMDSGMMMDHVGTPAGSALGF